MAVLPTADAVPILEFIHEKIPPTALADSGYENSSHVTIAYGFEATVTPERVQSAVAAWGKDKLVMTLGNVRRFSDNPAYDVLNVDLTFADDCAGLNRHLSETFGQELQQTYDYNGHLTLAYVVKGTCITLDGHAKFNGNSYAFKSLVFSLPESISKHVINLGADSTTNAVLAEHARGKARSTDRA